MESKSSGLTFILPLRLTLFNYKRVTQTKRPIAISSLQAKHRFKVESRHVSFLRTLYKTGWFYASFSQTTTIKNSCNRRQTYSRSLAPDFSYYNHILEILTVNTSSLTVFAPKLTFFVSVAFTAPTATNLKSAYFESSSSRNSLR